MLKKYVLLLFGLLIVLAINSYYHLNSSHFKNEIMSTMTYQVFKDSKTNVDKEEANKYLTIYIKEVLQRSLEKRNNIAGDMIRGNIFAIFFVCVVGIMHYILFIFKNNNSRTIMRLSIVMSIVWILIFFVGFDVMSRYSNIKGFIIIGLIPPILLIGLQWVKLSIIKQSK